MYLFACRIEVKIQISISSSKILCLAILIVCRKDLNHSDRRDCEFITIEGEQRNFFCGVPELFLTLKFNRN